MSTGAHRAVELLIGFALIGYCAYAIYTGRLQGNFRSYRRDESPWTFWITVLIVVGVATAFLLGAVTWRKG